MSLIEFKIESLERHISNALAVGSYQSSNLIILLIDNVEVSEFNALYKAEVTNLSKFLSERLVVMSNKERQKNITVLLEELIDSNVGICKLSRMDLLFEKSLNIDPMKLLQTLARIKPLVVIWPGEVDHISLSYSKPGNSDYKSYNLSELKEVQVLKTCTHGVNK